MNRYERHVYVIPEDDADRQIADGFVFHYGIDDRRMQVMPPAGGWRIVLKIFQEEYIQLLGRFPLANVVMLIDFDGHFAERRDEFEQAIPGDLKARVFVLGSLDTPETLKKVLGKNFEAIGESLAEDCVGDATVVWGHAHLVHNEQDRLRLRHSVRPFLI
jgi:hypothetical protein